MPVSSGAKGERALLSRQACGVQARVDDPVACAEALDRYADPRDLISKRSSDGEDASSSSALDGVAEGLRAQLGLSFFREAVDAVILPPVWPPSLLLPGSWSGRCGGPAPARLLLRRSPSSPALEGRMLNHGDYVTLLSGPLAGRITDPKAALHACDAQAKVFAGVVRAAAKLDRAAADLAPLSELALRRGRLAAAGSAGSTGEGEVAAALARVSDAFSDPAGLAALAPFDLSHSARSPLHGELGVLDGTSPISSDLRGHAPPVRPLL